MKALLFPFQRADELAPLRALCPDFLMPLAGKAVAEHLVEQLVTAGIRDVTLLCDDQPDETARHFGNGERWGCSVTVSAAREQGGLARMARAALHGVEGTVVCLPGNLAVSEQLTRFLDASAGVEGLGELTASGFGAAFALNAGALRTLLQQVSCDGLEELAAAARHAGLVGGTDGSPGLTTLTTWEGFLQAQRELLEGRRPGSRIPGREVSPGVWLGDHTEVGPGVRLVAPLLVGAHCRVSGTGQLGPNAVVSPYCLINGADLVCDSLVLPGTALGPHTELNGMAARGSTLVNLRNGAVVNTPDAFILGKVGGDGDRRSTGPLSLLLTFGLLLLLLPVGMPLLVLSLVLPGLVRAERVLGNRRRKVLTGDPPRTPFWLRQFSLGPLLLRRWPGLPSVVAGHLALVGAQATAEESDPRFGIDAARGLFHIWEVEGEPPESVEEQHVRENFHQVTRTFGADLVVVAKAATRFS